MLRTFDWIAIINLASRKDRKRECLRELKILGLTLTPGQVEFFPGQRVSTLEGFPSLGCRGNFLSHLALIREASKRGVKRLLVFEDDFEVPPESAERLAQIIDTAESLSWDFFYLGHRLSLPTSPTGISETTLPIVTAHALAINSSVFEPLADYLEACIHRSPGDPTGGPQYVDGAISMFRANYPQFTTLVTTPSQIRQRSSRSDISPRSMEDVPILRLAASITRQVINLSKQTHKLLRRNRDRPTT